MDGFGFTAKGLTSVVFDSYSGQLPTDGQISGSATLAPKDAFPLDKWALRTLEFPRKVRFKAVSARDREAVRLFKRNQTLFPLISSRCSAALQHASATHNRSISRSASQVRPPAFEEEHALSSSLPTLDAVDHRTNKPQLAAPFEDRIIGYFEDDWGCWLVSDDTGRVLGLDEYWAEIVEREGAQTEEEALAQADASDADRLKLGAKRYGGLAMDILIQMAEVLDGLHSRRLALGICTPEAFQVKFKPPAVPGAPPVDVSDKAIHEWEPRIEIIDLSAAVGIDGFSLPELGGQLAPPGDAADKRRSTSRSKLAPAGRNILNGARTPSPRSGVAPPPVLPSVAGVGEPASFASTASSGSSGEAATSSNVDGGPGPQGLNSEYFISHHLRWIAPEALSPTPTGERDARVGDVYSFGVLAYELITQSPVEPVHEQVDLLSDIHRHLNHSVVPAAERVRAKNALHLLPPRLSEILSYCLNKDPSARYSSMRPLMHDLRTFQSLSTSQGDMGLFSVGEADRASRFALPPRLIAREDQLGALDAMYHATMVGPSALAANGRPGHLSRDASTSVLDAAADGGSSSSIFRPTAAKGGLGLITIWGASGSGKSELMRTWARTLEASGQHPIFGWAKLDQHMHKPLSGFVQLFTSLLDQIFSDAQADVSLWREKIMTALGSQAAVFLNLIGPEWRDVLLVDRADVVQEVEMDWEHFLDSTRYWLKRVLQTFATAERPLVIFLDDIQWLADELPLWRTLLASWTNRLEHVFLVAGFRTEVIVGDNDVPPSDESLLSSSSSLIHVPRLNRPAIARYLQECFHWGETDPKQAYLSNFLASQTAGSPLFLASLICQLVRDRIVTFDWERMRWTFNIDDLPRHTASIDKFLESVLRNFESSTQELLMILSCIRSSGSKLVHLAGLASMTEKAANAALFPAVNAGVVSINDDTVRFKHDKQRVAGASLIPPERKAAIHHHIAQWILDGGKADEYIFDTVDCLLVARSIGFKIADEPGLAELALRAAARANRAAAFRQSLDYLKCADELVNLTEACSLPFAQSWAEVCALERQPDLAIEKLETMLRIIGAPDSLKKAALYIELQTLLVRLFINSGRLAEGVKLALQTVDAVGFDEARRNQVSAESLPRTPEAVLAAKHGNTQCSWFASDDEEALAVLVCKLCSYAGPAWYVALPDHGRSHIELAVGLTTRLHNLPLAQRADFTAYLFSVWAVSAVPTLPVRQAAVELAVDINVRGYFENATEICCVAQLHEWTDLHLLRPEFARAYESSVASGNWDAGTYVLGYAFITILFSRESILDHEAQLVSWFSIVEQLPHHSQVFVKAPLQACENLSDTSRPPEQLRILDGRLIRLTRDFDGIKDLPMYSLEFILLQLLLQVVFLGPWAEIEPILRAGDEIYHPFSGVVLMPLWVFVSAWYLITEGSDDQQDEAARKVKELEVFASTADFKAQLLMLRTAQSMREMRTQPPRWAVCMTTVEDALGSLKLGGFALLRGLLSFKWARVLVDLKGADSPLVVGYALAAHRDFTLARTAALARLVKHYFPGFGKAPETPTALSLPSETLAAFIPPSELPVPPASVQRTDSTSTGISSLEPRETTPSAASTDDALSKPDDLDSLTFIRASLVLAQSGNQIAVELMRILLQFTRASYGALALASSTAGTAALNLRASGAYETLSSYDVPLSEATELCPTSTILHVFRTGKAILSPATLTRSAEHDPFFKRGPPKSILVLPLVLQGRCRGVVVLLSQSFVATSPAATSLEMVSSLASFAVIAIESAENRSELERQVASRTEALQSALQSTTTFLSHMSHELRTPLHSVLGLLSVLEDSANLTPSERESLTTIRNSGEDLQTVISNVLDISKIQAGGIVAESIPLDLRNLIEISLESVAATAVQKGIEVVYTVGVAEDIPCGLLGDSFRVKQILLNLLSNACKFCPHNSGAIVEVTSSAEAVGDRLRITVSVKDTGPGIAASKMSRLFKTFSQVDSTTTRQHGGSGLGLAISKSLANLMGGDAWAESTLGEGATFSFSFMADKDAHSVTPVRPAHALPKSAFIVFRACAMRHALEKHLVAYRVFPCRTAPNHREAVQSSNPEALCNSSYDFVFVDAAIISDRELDTIRDLQPQAKIILLTTSLDRSSVMKRFTVSSDDLLVRPVRAHALYEMVRPSSSVTSAVATTIARVNKLGKQFDNTMGETSPLKILLVDDNRVNTVVGRKMLERFGYRSVDVAFDGDQAVNAAESTRYDVIFMDLSMPVCDGYEANKRISNSPLVGVPPPLVVALTANTDKGTRDLVIDEGFFAFLSKPLNVTALGTVLSQSYATMKDANARRRSSASGTSPGANAPMPSDKTNSPPSMVYLDVFIMGC